MRPLLTAVLFISLMIFGSQSGAAQVTAAKVGITFQTTNDDKDHDSKVNVFVKDDGGRVFATHEIGDSQFMDASVHVFALEMASHPSKGQLKSGHLLLAFAPRGRDTWRFQCRLSVHWSDGTTTEQTFPNLELKENKSLDLAIDGLK